MSKFMQQDNLDKALTACPIRKAPTTLRANVMSRIANEPQILSPRISQRRAQFGIIFGGLWSSLCILAIWLLWPLFDDGLWQSLTNFATDLLLAYGTVLPSLISGLAGLALMIVLVANNYPRRNFQLE